MVLSWSYELQYGNAKQIRLICDDGDDCFAESAAIARQAVNLTKLDATDDLQEEKENGNAQ